MYRMIAYILNPTETHFQHSDVNLFYFSFLLEYVIHNVKYHNLEKESTSDINNLFTFGIPDLETSEILANNSSSR